MHTNFARICADYGQMLHVFNEKNQPEPVTSLNIEQRPVVGDWVQLDSHKRIIGIKDSYSQITRIKSDGSTQPLAANVDHIWIFFPLDRDPSLTRWERFCLFAESQGFKPTIVLSKSDLCPNPQPWISMAYSLGFGEDIHLVSSETGTGTAELGACLAHGKTALLLGQSGAGKSSLANVLCDDYQPVAPVREADHRGRHTTTIRRLISTSAGGYLLDIPGLRELSWHGQDEMPDEFRVWTDQCLFSDCNHLSDKSCALIVAVGNGQIPLNRYEHWKKLVREASYLNRREDPKMASNSKRRWKQIHKNKRQKTNRDRMDDNW